LQYHYSHYPNYRPWGFDEGSWFDQLSDTCQAYWLRNATLATKNNIGHRLYLKLPGLNGMVCSVHPAPENSLYKITHHPKVLQAMMAAWEPDQWLDFSISTYGDKDNNRRKNVQYLLQVTRPDATSVYVWHVQDPEGQWLPYSFGTNRWIDNLRPGNYKVFLTATNLGFQNNDYVGDHKEQLQLEKTFYVGNKENQLNGRSGPQPVSDSSCCYQR